MNASCKRARGELEEAKDVPSRAVDDVEARR